MFGDKTFIILYHIAALFNDLHDAGIGGRAANAQLFHLFYQAGIGIAGRWLGEMLFGLNIINAQMFAFCQRRQQSFAFLPLFLTIIKAFTVNFQKARKHNDRAGSTHGYLIRFGRDIHPCLIQLGISHLACKGALPNQVI